MHKIITVGQKPDTTHVDKIASTLKENTSQFAIFRQLKEIVYRCWQFKPEARSKMSVVKQNLHQLVQNHQVHRKRTAGQVTSLIKQRKLKPQLPVMEKPNQIEFITPLIILAMIAVLVTCSTTYYMSSQPPQSSNSSSPVLEGAVSDSTKRTASDAYKLFRPNQLETIHMLINSNASCIFLALKYMPCIAISFCDISTRAPCFPNTGIKIGCAKTYDILQNLGVVKVNNTLYIFESHYAHFETPNKTYKVNLSNPYQN